MAKTISDEQMKLTMIINGNSAQKELFDLEKSTRKLNEENKALLLQKKLLEKQGKKDTDQYKLLTATIKANSAEVLTNKNRMSELQKEIGLTGLTMGQLQSKATMLRNTLRNLIPGSPDYLRYDAELTQVNNRLAELRGRAQASRSSIASLADGFNRYQALAVTFIAGLTGVVLSIQKIIDINGKLSDAQSDVMKTTRMTKEEVDSLTKSFGLLKTRTQRIDLLGIAAVGGELNIAKGEILDFVKVMDKSGVALGDSFEGGAEEVATKLGKIKNLYKELKESGVELAFESVGSALNDLGADGNATAANVAEFVTRVGSMPEAFKPSIAVALGLGAAFEETGLNAEKSASNYSKVITIAANNIEGFARVMGKPKKQMEDLMNTNPNEFFLQFSKSIANLKPVPLAKVLDSLKLNDNEVKQVISAAGANVDLFRQKINLANQSLNEGTSLTDEYNIKNNNLAATLEKISKRVSGWFSSEGFNNWLFSMVEGFGRLIGATDDVNGAGQKWRNTLVFIAKVIAIVTAALITNVGWQKLVAIWTTRNTEATLLYTIASKARAFADGVGMIASQAFAGVMMLLRGNVVGATQAFRVMTTTMMTTPWGFILGAIAAIGTAYVLFSDEAKEAATAQSMIADNAREVDALVQKQSSSFMSLMGVVNDTTASTEARTEALIRAKQIGGEYTKGLTLENAATLQGKTMIDAYIKSLEKKAMLQVLQKRQSSIMEDMDKKKNLSLEEEVAWYDKMWAQVKNLGNAGLASADLMVTAAQRRKGSLADLQKQLDFTNTEMNEFLKANPEIIKTIDVNGYTDSSSIIPDDKKTGQSSKNPNSTQEEINRIKLENEAKYADLFLKQQRQLEDDKIAAMQDGYEKEMLIEKQRYKREIDDLNRQKVNAAELAKLDEDIAKAKEAKDMTKYNALLIIRKGWDKKNQDLDTQINAIAEGKLAIHNTKLGIIQEKGAKEALQKRKEAFDQAKIIRETQFNEELAKLGTNERAKEKLRKKFALSELAEEEKFLKELVDQFNLIVGKGNFGKMDMSLLTPEQVESFTKEAAKVGLTLSELIAKKNELTGKEVGAEAAALGVSKGTTDIFGFTPENWVQLSDNLANGTFGINEMVFAVSALTDAWGKYNDFVTANENAQLKKFTADSDAKKTKLKKQLDSGMISQKQYNQRVEKIDEELDNKKAELEYKQAKRQKMIAISQIITSTAMAIIGIWAQFPKFDFGATAAIMSGVVGGLGALQLATVLATPLPAKGHEEGLYPEYVKRTQDGKTFKSKYQGKTRSGLVSETSHFLVAENGPEMVIDNKAWRQMDPAVKEALVRNLQGIKGFENGMYNTEKMRYEVPATTTAPASSANDTQLLEMVLAVVSENTAVMKDLRDKGVIGKFFKNDLQSAKNIQESINDYNDLRNKSKK
ncbi:phage tail tape measure protein [Flavobacterium sp. W1B]|uniref:phage tail tape measure protein n=1 Tax=Flavobacterium sp. W1B TaxID=3394146 RepID=UPI0039BC5AAE